MFAEPPPARTAPPRRRGVSRILSRTHARAHHSMLSSIIATVGVVEVHAASGAPSACHPSCALCVDGPNGTLDIGCLSCSAATMRHSPLRLDGSGHCRDGLRNITRSSLSSAPPTAGKYTIQTSKQTAHTIDMRKTQQTQCMFSFDF